MQNYVTWLRNAAPYINAHRGKTFVLVFSGEAVEHDNFANIIHDIALLASLGVKVVLVHGARKQITDYLATQNLQDHIVNDLRVTDRTTLHCVTAAVGTVRANIEALLSTGLANSPMHGAHIRVCSGNMVIAKPIGIRNGQDYQNTGVVRRIDAEAMQDHLNDGSVVLLSPMGYSPTGEVFNLSASDVAAQTAIALQADKLIVLGEQQGVLEQGQNLLRQITLSELKQQSQLHFDFRSAIINACENGVKRCHVISYQQNGALLEELFTHDGAGTLVSQDEYEICREATINDVGDILGLIKPLEEEGILVRRSREMLENEIHLFMVIERDGMVVACAALYRYPSAKSGEIACVAIHPDYRGEDRGERLVSALIAKAKSHQLQQVFVLTTVTAHWFQEQGFIEASIEQLPQDKKQFYNFQRNSKVFILNL